MIHVPRFLRPTSLALALILPMGAQEPPESQPSPSVRRTLEGWFQAGHFQGVALVAREGAPIVQEAVGQAQMEWGVPMPTDGIFRIGSLTKPLTATLVLRLVDAGKLSLEAPLSRLLPEYRADTGARVTLHHLLTHTSGIPSFTDSPELQTLSSQHHRVEAFVKTYCSGDLQFPPGSRFAYNNSGYYLLGAIVERVTGQSYGEALRTWVFEPLGMKDTRYAPEGGVMPRRVSGYLRLLGGLAEAPNVDASVLFSTGGVLSTASDLARWEAALHRDGFLSAGSRHRMFSRQTPEGGPAYGYGWFLDPLPGPGGPQPAIGHGGEVDGFNSLVMRFPEKRLTMVLLHNQGPTRLGALASALVAALEGQPAPVPRPSLLGRFGPVLERSGVAEAASLVRKLQADPASGFAPFSEEEAGTWAHYLERLGRPDHGARVLELILALDPKAWRAWQRLGELRERTGDAPGAREALAKAKSLRPQGP